LFIRVEVGETLIYSVRPEPVEGFSRASTSSQGIAYLSHKNNGLQSDKLRNLHKKICQTALARGLSATGSRPFLIGTKTKATPPNLPFSGEEPIARLNMLPPLKRGAGGVAF
jgi:hypothetical protein